jgi:phosphatidylglycerophosphate synthase
MSRSTSAATGAMVSKVRGTARSVPQGLKAPSNGSGYGTAEAVPLSTAGLFRSPFKPARRTNTALTASVEKRVLEWMAARMPAWVSSDGLTMLGLGAQIAAGACYALARYNRYALLPAILCIVLNWLGDSLDGTLARVRCQQRPRYGFYVDHMVDVFGAVALMGGLGLSGLVHWQVAMAMLVGFLLLSSESYLATYTLSRFEADGDSAAADRGRCGAAA